MLHRSHHTWLSAWKLRLWTQVLIPVWPAFYEISYLLSPRRVQFKPRRNFNFPFLRLPWFWASNQDLACVKRALLHWTAFPSFICCFTVGILTYFFFQQIILGHKAHTLEKCSGAWHQVTFLYSRCFLPKASPHERLLSAACPAHDISKVLSLPPEVTLCADGRCSPCHRPIFWARNECGESFSCRKVLRTFEGLPLVVNLKKKL